MAAAFGRITTSLFCVSSDCLERALNCYMVPDFMISQKMLHTVSEKKVLHVVDMFAWNDLQGHVGNGST